jgi:hypothetical protein
MPRASARASRSSLSSAVRRTSIGLPTPFFPGTALVGPGNFTDRKRSLSAPDASLRARISRITGRLSQAASDRNSRHATALAWSFISGETRVFRVSVQRIGTPSSISSGNEVPLCTCQEAQVCLRSWKRKSWKSYEMVLRYAHLAPEKLSFVAGRIERQPLRSVGEALRGENVAKNTTLALRSVH